jgi:hypothetical protein
VCIVKNASIRPAKGQRTYAVRFSFEIPSPSGCLEPVLAIDREGFASFFEFSLCLSRACLGKMIVLMYKWLKNAVLHRKSFKRHRPKRRLPHRSRPWRSSAGKIKRPPFRFVSGKFFPTICQDRLGTNIERGKEKRGRFPHARGSARDRKEPAGSSPSRSRRLRATRHVTMPRCHR